MAVNADNKHIVTKAARSGGGATHVLNEEREVVIAEMANLKNCTVRN